MAKYSLHGCDIDISDDGKVARVSRDGKLVDEFKCDDVLGCLETQTPTPQVQANRCAKLANQGKYNKPQPVKPAKDKEQ